ncbi:MAG: polysaccharide deacetylase, partial [Dyella sp.]
MHKQPVFFDPTGRRASRLSRLGLTLAVISTLFAIAFVLSLFVGPTMAGLQLGRHGKGLHALNGVKMAAPALAKRAAQLAAEVRAHHHGNHGARARGALRAPPPSLDKPAGRALAIGFYVNWDDSSYPSLKRALPTLDWVVPSWMSISGPDMALKTSIDAKALDLIRREKPSTPILPLLQNAVNGQWDGPGLAKMLANPDLRHERIAQIVAFLDANRFQGVTVDFEEVPDNAQGDFKQFLGELADA